MKRRYDPSGYEAENGWRKPVETRPRTSLLAGKEGSRGGAVVVMDEPV